MAEHVSFHEHCTEWHEAGSAGYRSCVEALHEHLIPTYQAAAWGAFTDDRPVTISRVWDMLVSGFNAPGNLLCLLFANYPPLHDFFEISASSFNSPITFFVSLIPWLVLWQVLLQTANGTARYRY